MDIRRRGLTKTYEAEKPLSICMCTTSHEILHTVVFFVHFAKQGKLQCKIFIPLQLKQNTLLYVYDGVISTAGIQNAK